MEIAAYQERLSHRASNDDGSEGDEQRLAQSEVKGTYHDRYLHNTR